MSAPFSKQLGSFNKLLAKLPQPVSGLSLLDVGCGFGQHLPYFSRDSVGLELADKQLTHCRERGLTVYKWSFLDPMPHQLDGRRFDAALLSHFLEHVFSPHQVLLRVRKHLKPDGLLIIHCPIVTLLSRPTYKLARRFKWQRGFHGALEADHVNFFTAKTLCLTCEYAGFHTEYVGTPYLPAAISRWMTRVWPTAWYIGRNVKSFQYADGSCKLLNEQGDVVWKI